MRMLHPVASAEATTLRAVIGRNLRAWREQQGLTADQLARELVRIGADWTGAKVINVEQGGREVLLDELVLIAMATGLSPADLLAGDDAAPVVVRGSGQATGGAGVSLDLARSVLTDSQSERTQVMLSILKDRRERERQSRTRRSPERRAAECAQLEAERKAARRLGVEPYDVALASLQLWGRCLTDERDARVAAASEPDAPPRTIQALRGHITRTLLAELAPTIEETSP